MVRHSIVFAALASVGFSFALQAQTQTGTAVTTTTSHLEACEAPLTKVLQSPKSDGTCPFNQPKINWSRYALQGSLDAEVAARQAADAALQSGIDAAIATAVAGGIQAALDAETAARTAADAALQQNIAAEAAARSAADATLQNNIDASVAARIAADATLQDNIDAEAAGRSAADATLQQNIQAEANARSNADNILQQSINAEANTRAAGDATTLNTAKAYTDQKVGQLATGSAANSLLGPITNHRATIILNDGATGTVTATCLNNTVAIAGGWELVLNTNPFSDQVRVVSSFPTPDGVGWQLRLRNVLGQGQAVIQAVVMCVKMTPP